MRGFGVRGKRYKFLICAAIVLLSAVSFAFSQKLPFKNYMTTDGLAHDRVNRIVRDSRGFLWFCTSEGLSRFDGYEFKNYTQDDGLPHRAVMDFLETRDGKFWVATGNGLVLFNPLGVSQKSKTENQQSSAPMFRAFRPENLNADSQSWLTVDLLEDSRGTIWLTSVNGLYRLESGGEDWRLQRVETEAWGHVSSIDFTSLLEDRTGAIWVGAQRGLFRLLPDGGVQKIDLTLRVGNGSLLEDRLGRIWVGTNGGESRGLYQFALPEGNGEPRLVRIFDSRDGLSNDHWMNALFETSDGRIFVGIGNGLCEYIPNAESGAKPFQKTSDHSMISLGEDSGGNLWLGTNTAGAFRMARRGFVAFDESDGLKTGAVPSIVKGSDGETYFITNPDGINRFDENRFTAILPLNIIQRNWGGNQVAFQDSAGEWWIDGGIGLQRYPKTARLEDLARTKPKRLYTTKDGLSDNSVFQLFEDSRGDIWIGVVNLGLDNLVHRWERATDTIHAYTVGDGFPAKNCPTAFGEDRAGNVWMGFYKGGLGRFLRRDGKFEQFKAEDGVPHGFIRDIHADREGRIWIATVSDGVIRIDNPTDEKPRLVNLTTAGGLTSNQANCVAEDDFGRIYIGTGRGVNRLDTKTGRIKIFTTADGLRENVVSLCQADAKGALWFGFYRGISRFVPEADAPPAPPPVFIGSVRVNGERAGKLSELGETTVENLEFNSEQRQIEIEFFALGFGTGETLRYQYKLDNSDWSKPTDRRIVNFNFSPGNYNFSVRAVNAEGVASENPARVSFSIARPIWQKWWFVLLAALAVSIVVYALYRYRLKRLIELERVRTRIATDLHDDIGSSLSQIAILSEVVRQKIGDNGANEPLNLIADTSREMVDSMSDIVWAINPQKDHLSDLVHRMRRFASDILDAKDVLYRFQLEEKSGDTALGADIRREVYLIFKECLNNLVKYSDATQVDLSVKVENNSLVISVKDNGKGFDVAEKLNGNSDGFGGNGLINMRRRAENLGGKFAIDSAKDAGTSVTIQIPVAGKLWIVKTKSEK